MPLTNDLTAAKEGRPLTRYCPFSRHTCVSNCEWHDGDGCIVWQIMKALRELTK